MKTERPNLVRKALEARSHVAYWLQEPQYRQILSAYIRMMWGRSTEDAIDSLRDKYLSSLRVGEMYAVADNIHPLLLAAADDLPDDYVAEPWHLHAQHGFLYFPEPLYEDYDLFDGENRIARHDSIDFLTWHHGTGTTNRDANGNLVDVERTVSGIEVNLWTLLRDRGEARYLPEPIGSDFLPYHLPSLGYRWHSDPRRLPAKAVRVPESRLSLTTRYVLALQIFMRQELPSIARWKPPRADAKRMRRLGLPDGDITVIDLRHRHYLPTDETGTSGRRQQVRSIVRGHYHRFWVGPNHEEHPGGTEERVLVWKYLLPYWRGPEDAPVKTTPDRVHVVRR